MRRSTFTIIVACLLAPSIALAGSFVIGWHTVDGGGVMFRTGGGFELSGTVGQPDAGALSGGDFTLTAGFWFPVVPGDADGDGAITLHDHAVFVDCISGERVGPPDGCSSLDSDVDGDIDLKDFASFQRLFSGG